MRIFAWVVVLVGAVPGSALAVSEMAWVNRGQAALNSLEKLGAAPKHHDGACKTMLEMAYAFYADPLAETYPRKADAVAQYFHVILIDRRTDQHPMADLVYVYPSAVNDTIALRLDFMDRGWQVYWISGAEGSAGLKSPSGCIFTFNRADPFRADTRQYP